MKILNKKLLDSWMEERRKKEHNIVSIRGIIKGAKYDDGTPIKNPINIAWQDTETGEVVHIEYEVPGK